MIIRAISVMMLNILMSFALYAGELIVENVDNVDFVADYYPSESTGNYGVVVVGGSGGGKPVHLAKKIAAMGYPVLSLAYFKEKSLPEELEMIPLEYFDAAKKWLIDQTSTRNDGLIVVGWSKGAELALLLASRDDDYKGVVGIAPSSVVWAGILNDWKKVPSSSWSVDGEPLPFVPFASGVKIKSLVDLYDASLNNKQAVKNATLQVQTILGPTLLLSGGQDEIWPANTMAKAACEKINAFKRHMPCQHINYPDAGHLLDENHIIGGTFESNAEANVDSTQKIVEFMRALQK